MRPLFHPSIECGGGILHALSGPVRVAMYADIVGQECPQSCSNFLAVGDKAIPSYAITALDPSRAGLIRAALRCGDAHLALPSWSSAPADTGVVTAHHPVGR
jgi:hypothetical protein